MLVLLVSPNQRRSEVRAELQSAALYAAQTIGAVTEIAHQQTANITNTHITQLYQMMWLQDPTSQGELPLENDRWMALFLDSTHDQDDRS